MEENTIAALKHQREARLDPDVEEEWDTSLPFALRDLASDLEHAHE